MLAKEPVHQVRSFRSHVYRKHRDVLDGGLPRSTIEGAGSERHGPEDDPDFDTSEDDPFEDFGHLISEVNRLQSSAARFLLKKQERKITQAAVDGIVHDVTDLWQMGMKEVHIVFY